MFPCSGETVLLLQDSCLLLIEQKDLLKEDACSLNSPPALFYTLLREITGVKSQHDLSTNYKVTPWKKRCIHGKHSRALQILWENICGVRIGKTDGASLIGRNIIIYLVKFFNMDVLTRCVTLRVSLGSCMFQ